MEPFSQAPFLCWSVAPFQLSFWFGAITCVALAVMEAALWVIVATGATNFPKHAKADISDGAAQVLSMRRRLIRVAVFGSEQAFAFFTNRFLRGSGRFPMDDALACEDEEGVQCCAQKPKLDKAHEHPVHLKILPGFFQTIADACRGTCEFGGHEA